MTNDVTLLAAAMRTAADTLDAHPDRWLRDLLWSYENTTGPFPAEPTCACALGMIELALEHDYDLLLPYGATESLSGLAERAHEELYNVRLSFYNDQEAENAHQVADRLRELADRIQRTTAAMRHIAYRRHIEELAA